MKKPIPFGKYYLLNRLSVGKKTEVFKAKAFGGEGFERMIAVKRMMPDRVESDESTATFIEEAKIGVQLQHPNIVQTFDLGMVGKSYFMVLEYIHGRDLQSITDRLRAKNATMPIPVIVYIAIKVCEGLDYAHNKKDWTGRFLNLVHRKINPKTILVSFDGEVKIVNLGMVKTDGKSALTQAGAIKGKMGYMSPEQACAFPTDRRSDIFAVGICLWEMLTGKRLFDGETDLSTLEKIRSAEIARPSEHTPGIPEPLETIVMKALSKEAEDRYQNAADLQDDLHRWMYESGNFFARKAVEAFMVELFQDEIVSEATAQDIFG